MEEFSGTLAKICTLLTNSTSSECSYALVRKGEFAKFCYFAVGYFHIYFGTSWI